MEKIETNLSAEDEDEIKNLLALSELAEQDLETFTKLINRAESTHNALWRQVSKHVPEAVKFAKVDGKLVFFK
jgi:hypothetical protein